MPAEGAAPGGGSPPATSPSAAARAAAAEAAAAVRAQEAIVRRQQEELLQQQARQEQAEAEQPQTYNAERVIGNGTFGIVYSAHIVETDEIVAIKKVFVDRRYRNKELQVWLEMQHPNIVRLKNSFYTSGDSPDELYLNMVMEFVPETVYCVMKRFGKQRQPMPKILVNLYTYQACRALAHLHASNVVHRDIKPQNLLVDASKGHMLKLCDFGSAARLSRDGCTTLVAYICSRYYRAPELIFGSVNYTAAVDLWSIGCVLAEMLRGRPLFPGENGVDQLVEIVKVLGAPTRNQVLAMNPQYATCNFPSAAASSWGTVFGRDVGPEVLSLMSAFLEYDPEARILPLEACAHHCFDGLRDEGARCPEGTRLAQDLFNFTNRERRSCSTSLMERLVPAWYAAKLAAAAAQKEPAAAAAEAAEGAVR